MFVRAVAVAAILTGAACSACGPQLKVDPSRAAAPTSTILTASPTRIEPYAEPSKDLSRVARRFVTATVAYNAANEARRAFITRARALSTSEETRRLRTSARNRLDWVSLAARHETVTVAVTGITADVTTNSRIVMVEGTRTTQTDFATVRDNIAVRLELTRIAGKWLVTRASGAGL